MRHGVFIPAWVMRVLTLVTVALLAAAAKREYPEVRRYLKSETM
jgi:hypothetical protein